MTNSQKQAVALGVLVVLGWVFGTFSPDLGMNIISAVGLIIAYTWFILVTPSERTSRPVSYVQSRIAEGLRRAQQPKGK